MTNNYFYGVDYLKMKLFCRIKSIESYYELQKYLKVKFDWELSYEVLIDYRADLTVVFEVLNTDDELIKIKVNYHFIYFFYFFENMEEQEKVYLNDCIR
jgi:hypothetical protein